MPSDGAKTDTASQPDGEWSWQARVTDEHGAVSSWIPQSPRRMTLDTTVLVPGNLQVTRIDRYTYQVTWDPVPYDLTGIKGYWVTVRTESTGGTTLLHEFTTDTSFTCSVNTLDRPYFAVQAEDLVNGEGAAGNISQEAQWPPLAPPPDKPSGLNCEVSPSADGSRFSYHLSWAQVAQPAHGYRVLVGSRPGLTDIDYVETNLNTFDFVADANQMPYFVIQALNQYYTPSAAAVWPDETNARIVRSAWAYDEVGNRTWQHRKGVDTSYTSYSDTNELTALTEGATPFDFTYDENGNLTDKTSPTETWHYAYDNQNRLVEVSKSGSPVVAYAHDVFGRRIKAAELRDGLAKLTIFVYSEIGVTYEEAYGLPNGTLPSTALNLALDDPSLTLLSQTEYVRGNGQLVAKIGATSGGEVATYYHQDHLGSTRAQTNQNGTLVSRVDYEPFGWPLNSPGERYTYTGQYMEGSTNLYYYGARFYDPALGRFVTSDTWTNLPDDKRGYTVGGDPGKYNGYAYVFNNPVMYNDPTGHLVEAGGGGGPVDTTKDDYTMTYETTPNGSEFTLAERDTKGNVVVGRSITYIDGKGNTSVRSSIDYYDPEGYWLGGQTDYSLNGLKRRTVLHETGMEFAITALAGQVGGSYNVSQGKAFRTFSEIPGVNVTLDFIGGRGSDEMTYGWGPVSFGFPNEGGMNIHIGLQLWSPVNWWHSE